MILTTMSPCLLPKKRMTIMAHVVLDRLPLQRTRPVALALLMNPESRVFAFSQNLSAMWTKLWLSITATKTYLFIAVAGVLPTTEKQWVLLHISSRNPFSMGSIMAEVERVPFLYSQVAMGVDTAINATSTVIQIAYTPLLSLLSITWADIHFIRKPVQPT